jgi:hypothetical protein
MSRRDSLEQERDRVPVGRVVWVVLAGLATFAVGGAWSSTVQRDATGSVRAGVTDASAAHAGQPEIGMVYQRPFAKPIAAATQESARERLESTGWVDRDAGVAHVPIEQAMDLVVTRGHL